MKIQPIVEGHGEVEAVPILLRRLIAEAQAWQIEAGSPIRRTRHQLVHEPELVRSVRIALEQPDCGAILIWRPNLPDEADNHVIELAVAGGAEAVVTYNRRDFERAELHFPRLRVVTPGALIGEE